MTIGPDLESPAKVAANTSTNSQSDAIKSCNNCFEFDAACERPMGDRSGCPKWVATF